MDNAAHRHAEQVARTAYGKLLAILASRASDVQAAEDALADAFERALRTWPRDGIPSKPEAWLLTTARNRRIDAARRGAREEVTDEVPDMPAPSPMTEDDDLPDERLRLLFVCAHPAIDAQMHTPLMLQTVLGLEAAQIASAFQTPPATMAQRLVRAKRKIKAARIPFAVPGAADRPARLGAVREAVYGALSHDWQSAGPLAEEALYLATLLARLAPDDAESLGLAALATHIHARRGARTGAYVPLDAQDTDLWDHPLIDQANRCLSDAAALGQMGRFQLEAAIQSVHAARRDSGQTDWHALSQLYAGLMHIAPTLGAAIGQAAALGAAGDPTSGLAALDRLPQDRLATFQPAWATRAHLHALAGQNDAAWAAYDQAIALAADTDQQQWLEQEQAKLRGALH